MSMIRLYTFLIFVAIATVILYVFFVMPQPDYVGKTSLLITPQTQLIASDTDSVMNNIVFMTQSVLSGSDVIKEGDAKVSVARLSGTSIVQFIVRAESAVSVGNVKNIVIKEALAEVSKYYDINTDFTIKVVEKEVAHKTTLSTFALYVVMVVVAIGLIAGLFALFYVIDLFRMKNEYDENIDGKKIFADYYSDKILHNHENDNNGSEGIIVMNNDDNKDGDTGEIEKKKNIIKKDEDDADSEAAAVDKVVANPKHETVSDEAIIEKPTFIATSGAPEGLPTTPGNLPVVDMNDFGPGENASSDGADIQNAEDLVEPTEEELKARLNELLDGKL